MKKKKLQHKRHTISEECKVSTSNNSNSNVELSAREAVEFLAHDGNVRGSALVYNNQEKSRETIKSQPGLQSKGDVAIIQKSAQSAF